MTFAYSTCWLAGKELGVWSALVSVKWISWALVGSHLLSEDHMHQAHSKQQTSDKAKHDSTWPREIRFCHAIM